MNTITHTQTLRSFNWLYAELIT